MRKVDDILKFSELLQSTKSLKEKIDELDSFIANSVTENNFDLIKEVELASSIRELMSHVTVSYIEAASNPVTPFNKLKTNQSHP